MTQQPGPGAQPPLLAAQGVVLSFGANKVLDGVDFAVRAGEAVGIVGPNGAGKTTLLAALSGSLRAAAGTVRLDGHDVTALDAARRCRLGVARSHQVPRPFGGMTVFENVLTAALHGGGFAGPEACERSLDAIAVCGMTDVANRRAAAPGLLDRQRLELTRAPARRADEGVVGSAAEPGQRDHRVVDGGGGGAAPGEE
mgnify:CR=1 FL=1